MNPSLPDPAQFILGIHHLKVAVSSLERSLAFYEWILGAKRIPQADHRKVSDHSLYAFILDAPRVGCRVELRADPDRADGSRGWDPLTLAVSDRAALNSIQAAFEAAHVPHSPIITGVQGWLLVAEDPDGLRLRFYTLEQHGLDLSPDEDNAWLRA